MTALSFKNHDPLSVIRHPTSSAIRRSIAAATDMPVGTVLTDEHFTWLRPGMGLPPGSEEQLCGRKTLRDLARGGLIGLDDVE